MNKKLFSLIIFILGFNLVNAQQVDFKTVEKVAQNYFTAIKPNVKNNTPELVYTGKANYEDKTGNEVVKFEKQWWGRSWVYEFRYL